MPEKVIRSVEYPQARILVFCKAPQAGKVKTRLARDIGESAAAQVHEHLAWHCLQNLIDYAIAPVELWCAPDTEHEFFRQCQEELKIPLKQQVGDDLGQRMQHAFAETLEHHSSAVLIGTDCPMITADYLRAAFVAIGQNKTAIGPAEDGGYVLLGASTVQPRLFLDMPWGMPQVYAETMARIAGDIEILKPLWDVDYVADLRRLNVISDSAGLDAKFQIYLESLDVR